MNDDASIRRANLNRLVKARKLGPSALSRAYEGSPTPPYWSDLQRGKRDFGEKAARAIEAGLGLPRGWLDQSDELLPDPGAIDSIGKRLAHARTMKGWTQAQLARAAGIKSAGTVGNIEADTRAGLPSLPDLAKALDVRLEWLRDWDGPMQPTYSAEALRVAALYDAITDPELQRRARVMIRLALRWHATPAGHNTAQDDAPTTD